EDEVMPKIAGLVPPGQIKPTEETIQGQSVHSLPLDLLGPGTRLYYGRHGKTLVFGLNGADTAAALAGGAKNVGLLADAMAATAVKDAGDASILGVMPLSSVLPLIIPEESRMRFKAPA